MPPKRKPPTPGEDLVAAIRAELLADGLQADARDEALLEAARKLVDRQAELEQLVQADGTRTVSNTGMVRLHPAIAEIRQTASALARVLSAIGTSDDGPHRKDPAKVRAATSRWRAHNTAKGA